MLELDYNLFLTEEKDLKRIEKCVKITFGNHENIPAIMCSRGKSTLYVAESKFFNNGYVLFWRNEYIGLQFLGLTLQIHKMEIIEENPDPLKDYSDSKYS